MPAIADESMQALLRSVMKTAADNVNPPTSGPGSGSPDNEATYTEGSRSAENDAEIKDQLGVAGVEGAPPATAHTGDYGQSFNAAPIAPTGEDTVGSSQTPPSNIEPGTGASGLSLGEKTSKWFESAADLFVDLCVDQKVAAATAQTSPAGNQSAKAAADAQTTEGEDNPYLLLAGGDEKLAADAYQQVQSLLVEAHMDGKKLAAQTLQYLDEVKKEAKNPKANTPACDKTASRRPVARKLSMGMPGEMPPAEGGDPMAGGMPPEMGPAPADPMAGGGGDAALEQDPQVIEAALQELANELGVPPEQLVELLMSEGGGSEGGMPPEGAMPPDMGGAPAPAPEPAPEPSSPPSESAPSDSGESESEPSESEDKEAADIARRFKIAAAITNVKKRACDVISEKVRRGQR